MSSPASYDRITRRRTHRTSLQELRSNEERGRTTTINALRLQLDAFQTRLAKLADYLIDGTIDKAVFNEKQEVMLQEQARLKERLAEIKNGSPELLAQIERTVELAKSPSILYLRASAEEKREMLKTVLSNLIVSGKNVEMALAIPFRIIAEREKTSYGGANRGTCRTWEIIKTLLIHFAGQLKPRIS